MLVLQMIAALRRARQGIAVMYVQISKAEYERHGKVLEAQRRGETEKKDARSKLYFLHRCRRLLCM